MDTDGKEKEVWRKTMRAALNPRFLLCFGLAWMVTNGWAYVFVLSGLWFHIPWMTAVGGGYAGFMWLPFTPEKIITLLIAVFLLRRLFPRDERTLAVLRREYARLKEKFKRKKLSGRNANGNAESY